MSEEKFPKNMRRKDEMYSSMKSDELKEILSFFDYSKISVKKNKLIEILILKDAKCGIFEFTLFEGEIYSILKKILPYFELKTKIEDLSLPEIRIFLSKKLRVYSLQTKILRIARFLGYYSLLEKVSLSKKEEERTLSSFLNDFYPPKKRAITENFQYYEELQSYNSKNFLIIFKIFNEKNGFFEYFQEKLNNYECIPSFIFNYFHATTENPIVDFQIFHYSSDEGVLSRTCEDKILSSFDRNLIKYQLFVSIREFKKLMSGEFNSNFWKLCKSEIPLSRGNEITLLEEIITEKIFSQLPTRSEYVSQLIERILNKIPYYLPLSTLENERLFYLETLAERSDLRKEFSLLFEVWRFNNENLKSGDGKNLLLKFNSLLEGGLTFFNPSQRKELLSIETAISFLDTLKEEFYIVKLILSEILILNSVKIFKTENLKNL